MFSHDEIPKIIVPLPHELGTHEVEWDEFANSTNRIFIYTAPNGEPRIRFDHIGDDSFANFVAIVSQPYNKKFYEFLKVCMEICRLIIEDKKKSFQKAIKVEEVLKVLNPKEKNLGNLYTKRVPTVKWEEDKTEPVKRKFKVDKKQKQTKQSNNEAGKQSCLDFDEPPF